MKLALWVGFFALMSTARSTGYAQGTDADAIANQGRVADAWMLHLEDQLDTQATLGTYVAAPIMLADAAFLGWLATNVSEQNGVSGALLAGSSALSLASAVSYYAISDPEDAGLTLGRLSGAASGLLFASFIPLAPTCTEQFDGSCIRTASGRDARYLAPFVTISLLSLSLALLSHMIFSPPPRVADLRVNFHGLTAAAKTARLLDHMRTRERGARRLMTAIAVIEALSAGAVTFAATQVETTDTRIAAGTVAGILGVGAIAIVVGLLVETPDSERVLAGELPDE